MFRRVARSKKTPDPPLTLAAGEPLGRGGEDLVAAELEARGFVIVARNARIAGVEVDVLARRRRDYLLVEVKTRRGAPRPEESLTAQQRRRLTAAAGRIAEASLRPAPKSVRLAVAAVTVAADGRAELRFFEVSTGEPQDLR